MFGDVFSRVVFKDREMREQVGVRLFFPWTFLVPLLLIGAPLGDKDVEASTTLGVGVGVDFFPSFCGRG